MPPPVADLSDDESTGESIPYDDAQNVKDEPEDVKDDEDEEGEEDEEGIYIVEKIMGHSFKPDGTLMLEVKWQGYDDPKDRTLEPEENLVEGAKDIVEDYFAKLGGRPEKPQAKKRKSIGRPKSTTEKPEKPQAKKRKSIGRPKSTTEKPEKPLERETKKRRKSSRADDEPEPSEDAAVPDWVPKSKSWENEVKRVHTIVREGDSLVAFLHWNNDKKSKVSIETCYEKCPRKMLQFYEQHLVFKD